MSTAERKKRKRAGEKFVRVPKVGTPPEDRLVQYPVPGAYGTRNYGRMVHRSEKKVAKTLKKWGAEL